MNELRRPSTDLVKAEEDRLVDFVESATVGLHWVASDGTILWANPADYEPLGYSAEEYIGHNIAEFHADEPVIEDILGRLSSGERIEEYEARLRCKDGSTRSVRITSSVLFDPEGNFVHTRCFTRDVTELKKVEDELREKSEELRRITDTVPALISYIGPDLRYRFMNRSYERWFGIDREASIGMTMEQVLGRDAVESLRPQLTEVLSGEQVQFESRVPFQAGGPRFVRANFAPSKDDRGDTEGLIALVEDITSQKAAQDRIRLLGEASELLASSLDVDVTLSELAKVCVPRFADWCCVDVSDEQGESRQLALVHTEPEKVELARELRRRFPLDPEAPAGIARVLQTGEPQHLAHIPEALFKKVASDPEHEQLLRRLGLKSYIAVPMMLRGRVLGVVAVASAESERQYEEADVEFVQELARRAAHAIENARLFAAAQEATRRKDEFLAMLGHELRNPLAPIRTALEMMKLKGDGSTFREQQVIHRQVEHMVRLVDDLLDVSRVTNGKVHLAKECVEMARVVAKALEMAGSLLEQRAHRLSVDVPRHGLMVDVDPARMAQVIANLLTNAAKYTEPRGDVTVRARRDGGEVVVDVQDNGIGISEELGPRIFELFSQSPQALDRSQGGLGIGLKLVQSLVEMHDGTIAVHSEGVGQGSCFTVRLPAIGDVATEEIPRSSQPDIETRGALRSILVVDDNEDAAQMMAEALRAAGHEVRIAHDGPSALALVDGFEPEIGLLDIGLPVMDGYELGGHLREKLGPDLRLFSVTGYGLDADQERSMNAGFERHLVKPVSLGALLQALG